MSEPVRSAGPSICPNCRAIVSAGEPVCPQCGTSLAKRRPVEPDHNPATARFINAILSRPAPFTLVFIVLCVVVYFWMVLAGGAEGAGLVAFGAKLNRLLDQGEWWRLVTPIFLHVPMGALPLHLLVNMWALWNLGPYVEKFYGSAKFVVIWVVTGICGIVLSYYSVRPGMQIGSLARFFFKPQDIPSAGASGALFGLFGVLIVFGIKYRNELPEGFKRAFGTGLLPVLLINFGIGFFARGYIDNAAHIGGLLSGIVLGLVLDYERPGAKPMMGYFWRVLQVAALGLIVVSYFMLWRHYQPAPKPEAVEAFMVSVNQGGRAMRQCLTAEDPAKINKEELTKAHEFLSTPSHLSPSADAVANDLLGLVQRCESLAATRDPAAWASQRAALGPDFTAWDQRSDRWVETEGAIYGLRKDESDKPDQPAGK
jgi:membrane associated rhomboid family serine protease